MPVNNRVFYIYVTHDGGLNVTESFPLERLDRFTVLKCVEKALALRGWRTFFVATNKYVTVSGPTLTANDIQVAIFKDVPLSVF